MRVSMRQCKTGMKGETGWLVLYGGSLVAVLQKSDDGTVFLATGIEEPFVCVMSGRDSLEDAKTFCNKVGKFYNNSLSPKIDFTSEKEEEVIYAPSRIAKDQRGRRSS